MSKYEFTDETKEVDGVTVKRIRYTKAISKHGVSVGDLGGWLEREENLSHRGNCAVLDEAVVTGKAKVHKNAVVKDNARIEGYCLVDMNAIVGYNARIFGSAWIKDDSKVDGGAQIGGHIKVEDTVIVRGNATLTGYAVLCEGRVIESADDCSSEEIGG